VEIIFHILEAAFPPPATIEMKFCTGKRAHVPVGNAKFDVNRCNCGAKNLNFWPVSKFNTSSLPLGGIVPVKKRTPYLRTYSRRALYYLPQT